MTKLEQAARQALGALEVATTPLAKDRQEVLRAITTLREALSGVQALSAAPVVPHMSAAEVNNLPAHVRAYIHQLATLCDPAGLVRENVQLLDTNNALQKMYRRAADACAEVFGCFATAEIEGLKDALSDTTDDRLKDLVERRLMYAMHAVRDIAASPTPPAEQQTTTKAAPVEPTDSDGFGSAEHWKEKTQYWAGVAHRLRGEALRGEPVDGIVQPPAPQPVAREPLPKFLALKFHARRDKKAAVTLLFPGHEAADAWVRGITGGQHGTE